jgi:hypothetical protein
MLLRVEKYDLPWRKVGANNLSSKFCAQYFRKFMEISSEHSLKVTPKHVGAVLM